MEWSWHEGIDGCGQLVVVDRGRFAAQSVVPFMVSEMHVWPELASEILGLAAENCVHALNELVASVN